MKVEGACHCGHITFDAELDPGSAFICHCTDCQTLTGSAYRVNALTKAEDFHLRSGPPAVYVKTAQSGNKRAQAFCPRCGTPIYSAAPHDPQVYVIRVGTLKQRLQLSPKRQLWSRSALHWAADLHALPHLEQQ
ncbi:MAG: GFA family protein [Steroidobacteraceae bacterium]